jgi:hypothetical protein
MGTGFMKMDKLLVCTGSQGAAKGAKIHGFQGTGFALGVHTMYDIDPMG